MNQNELFDEAIYRLEHSGFSENVAETLKKGMLPVDTRNIDLGLTQEQIFELARQLENSADVVIYGAVGLNYDGSPAVAYLMINKDPNQWRFEHEMYEEKYPLCFVAHLENPDISDEGYLEIDGVNSRLYKLVSPESLN